MADNWKGHEIKDYLDLVNELGLAEVDDKLRKERDLLKKTFEAFPAHSNHPYRTEFNPRQFSEGELYFFLREIRKGDWWEFTGSNRGPLPCKGSALTN